MSNAGRRATPAELQIWRNRLAEWRTPTQFSRSVHAMARILGDHAIDQADSCFRDAYTAYIAAHRSSADWVRLGNDPPDFELISKGKHLKFESVEVQAPDRRRGDELKADRNLPLKEGLALRHVGDSARVPTIDALRQLSGAVLKKSMHTPPYQADTILAVYLNPGFVEGDEKLEKGIEAAISCGFPSFAEVWVLRTTGETRVFLRAEKISPPRCPTPPPPSPPRSPG